MVHGLTDTECRIAEFRYRELQAEGDRQRRAASAAPVATGRGRGMETLRRSMSAFTAQCRHLVQRVRAHQAVDPIAAPGTAAN